MSTGTRQKSTYHGLVFESIAALYRHLKSNPPAGVSPNSRLRTFSARVTEYLDGQYVQLLNVNDSMATAWLVNHHKKGPNTVDQSPILFKGVRYPSHTQFYRAVKTYLERPVAERTFNERCSNLRKDQSLARHNLLVIKDENDLQRLLQRIQPKSIRLQVWKSEHFTQGIEYGQAETLKLLSTFIDSSSLCTAKQFNYSVYKHYKQAGRKDHRLDVTEQDLLELAKPSDGESRMKYDYHLDVDGTIYRTPSDAYYALLLTERFDISCGVKDFGNRLLKEYHLRVKNGSLTRGLPLILGTGSLLSYAAATKETDLCVAYRFTSKKTVFDDGQLKHAVYCGVTSQRPEDRWNHYQQDILAVMRGENTTPRPVIEFMIKHGGWDAMDKVLIFHDERIPRYEINAWEKAEVEKQKENGAIINLNAIAGGGSSDKVHFTPQLAATTFEQFFALREKKGMQGKGVDVPKRFKQMIKNGYCVPFWKFQTERVPEETAEEYKYWLALKDCLLKLRSITTRVSNCIEEHPKINGKYMGIEFVPNETKERRWFVYWQCNDCTARSGGWENPVIYKSRWSKLREYKGCSKCKGFKQSGRQRMPKDVVALRFQAVGLYLKSEELAKHKNNTTKMMARVNCNCPDVLADLRKTCVDKLGKNIKKCRYCKEYGSTEYSVEKRYSLTD